jgi:predicted protein tyrosine phosphatase
MPAIFVCPLSRLAETVETSGARHMVTLIKETNVVRRPDCVRPDDHLLLCMDDICDPMDGMTVPCEAHLEDLFRFVETWDRSTPLVVHCWAGISRSTAAAYSAMCALRPDLDEAAIAERLRLRSPEATPNARLVALADDMLGRRGRMVDAVRRIGRGTYCFEGRVFSLALDE